MRETFRPEFLNRIDEIIIFEPLSQQDVEKMVDLQLQNLAQRLREAVNISIHLTEPARYWIARQGYDPNYGARPLRRTIQRFVENPLSTRLLSGQFRNGDLILIDEVGEQLVFERHQDAVTDFIEVRPTPPQEYYPSQEEVYHVHSSNDSIEENYYIAQQEYDPISYDSPTPMEEYPPQPTEGDYQ